MPGLRRRLAATIVTSGFVVAACHDLPTGDMAARASGPGGPPAGLPGVTSAVGPSAHVCFTSVRTPEGPRRYRYGHVNLDFPASAQAPDGATVLYRYRVQAPGEDPRVVANCRIPRTPEAIRIMDRRLYVDHRRRWLASGTAGAGDTATIDGCVTYGTCPLEPITVSPYDPYGGTGGGGGGSSSCGLNASAGDCWYDGDGDYDDPGPDGTYRPECERDAGGNCITRNVSLAEWDEFKERVELIKETYEYCRGAKQALRNLIAQGREAERIRFWDGYDMVSDTVQRVGQNLSDSSGRYIEYDSHWVWNDRSLIVHEGIHYWLDLNSDNTGLVGGTGGLTNEQWVRSVDQNCV